MMNESTDLHGWQKRKRPLCLERRFEFESYSATRDFLDRLGDHCEAVKRFPDMNFGRTYVNITLRPEDDGDSAELGELDYQFALEINGFFD